MNSIKIFILGSCLLIAATYISTIQLSSIEHKTTEVKESINKHLSQTRNNILMILFYESKNIRNQLSEFQRNIFILLKSLLIDIKNSNTIKGLDITIQNSDKAAKHLDKSIEENAINIAEGWSTLWSKTEYGNIKNAKKEFNVRVDKIMHDASLSNEEKMNEIRVLRTEGVNRVQVKQKVAEKQMESNKVTLKQLRKKQVIWKKIYAVSQIAGLILVGLSQFMLIKSKPASA